MARYFYYQHAPQRREMFSEMNLDYLHQHIRNPPGCCSKSADELHMSLRYLIDDMLYPEKNLQTACTGEDHFYHILLNKVSELDEEFTRLENVLSFNSISPTFGCYSIPQHTSQDVAYLHLTTKSLLQSINHFKLKLCAQNNSKRGRTDCRSCRSDFLMNNIEGKLCNLLRKVERVRNVYLGIRQPHPSSHKKEANNVCRRAMTHEGGLRPRSVQVRRNQILCRQNLSNFFAHTSDSRRNGYFTDPLNCRLDKSPNPKHNNFNKSVLVLTNPSENGVPKFKTVTGYSMRNVERNIMRRASDCLPNTIRLKHKMAGRCFSLGNPPEISKSYIQHKQSSMCKARRKRAGLDTRHGPTNYRYLHNATTDYQDSSFELQDRSSLTSRVSKPKKISIYNDSTITSNDLETSSDSNTQRNSEKAHFLGDEMFKRTTSDREPFEQVIFVSDQKRIVGLRENDFNRQSDFRRSRKKARRSGRQLRRSKSLGSRSQYLRCPVIKRFNTINNPNILNKPQVRFSDVDLVYKIDNSGTYEKSGTPLVNHLSVSSLDSESADSEEIYETEQRPRSKKLLYQCRPSKHVKIQSHAFNEDGSIGDDMITEENAEHLYFNEDVSEDELYPISNETNEIHYKEINKNSKMYRREGRKLIYLGPLLNQSVSASSTHETDDFLTQTSTYVNGPLHFPNYSQVQCDSECEEQVLEYFEPVKDECEIYNDCISSSPSDDIYEVFERESFTELQLMSTTSKSSTEIYTETQLYEHYYDSMSSSESDFIEYEHIYDEMKPKKPVAKRLSVRKSTRPSSISSDTSLPSLPKKESLTIKRDKYLKVGSRTFKRGSQQIVQYDTKHPSETRIIEIPESQPSKETFSVGTSTEKLSLAARRTSTTDLVQLVRAIGTNTKKVSIDNVGLDPIAQDSESTYAEIHLKSKRTNTEPIILQNKETETSFSDPKPKQKSVASDPLYYLGKSNKKTNTLPELKKNLRDTGTDPKPKRARMKVSLPPMVSTATDAFYPFQEAKSTNTESIKQKSKKTETLQRPLQVSQGTTTPKLLTKDQRTSYDDVETIDKGNDPIPLFIKTREKGMQFDTAVIKPKVASRFTETDRKYYTGKLTQTTPVESPAVSVSKYSMSTQTPAVNPPSLRVVQTQTPQERKPSTYEANTQTLEVRKPPGVHSLTQTSKPITLTKPTQTPAEIQKPPAFSEQTQTSQERKLSTYEAKTQTLQVRKPTGIHSLTQTSKPITLTKPTQTPEIQKPPTFSEQTQTSAVSTPTFEDTKTQTSIVREVPVYNTGTAMSPRPSPRCIKTQTSSISRPRPFDTQTQTLLSPRPSPCNIRTQTSFISRRPAYDTQTQTLITPKSSPYDIKTQTSFISTKRLGYNTETQTSLRPSPHNINTQTSSISRPRPCNTQTQTLVSPRPSPCNIRTQTSVISRRPVYDTQTQTLITPKALPCDLKTQTSFISTKRLGYNTETQTYVRPHNINTQTSDILRPRPCNTQTQTLISPKPSPYCIKTQTSAISTRPPCNTHTQTLTSPKPLPYHMKTQTSVISTRPPCNTHTQTLTSPKPSPCYMKTQTSAISTRPPCNTQTQTLSPSKSSPYNIHTQTSVISKRPCLNTNTQTLEYPKPNTIRTQPSAISTRPLYDNNTQPLTLQKSYTIKTQTSAISTRPVYDNNTQTLTLQKPPPYNIKTQTSIISKQPGGYNTETQTFIPLKPYNIRTQTSVASSRPVYDTNTQTLTSPKPYNIRTQTSAVSKRSAYTTQTLTPQKPEYYNTRTQTSTISKPLPRVVPTQTSKTSKPPTFNPQKQTSTIPEPLNFPTETQTSIVSKLPAFNNETETSIAPNPPAYVSHTQTSKQPVFDSSMQTSVESIEKVEEDHLPPLVIKHRSPPDVPSILRHRKVPHPLASPPVEREDYSTPSELSMHLVFEKHHEEIYKRRRGRNQRCCSNKRPRKRGLIICHLKKSNNITINNQSEVGFTHENSLKSHPERSSSDNSFVTVFRKHKRPPSNSSTEVEEISKGNPRSSRLQKTKLSEKCGMNVYKTRTIPKETSAKDTVNEEDNGNSATNLPWRTVAERVKENTVRS